jgi:hypothetical protein
MRVCVGSVVCVVWLEEDVGKVGQVSVTGDGQ